MDLGVRITTGTDRLFRIVIVRYDEMVVVVTAIKGTGHNNVWENGQLCDSLEMHRAWPPFLRILPGKNSSRKCQIRCTNFLSYTPL
jgi:hypothetical protein